MSGDIPLARREAIAIRLAAGEAVNSSTLAVEYQVSEDAIRRDLRALAASGLCRRVYGGALPLGVGTIPLAERIDRDLDRKRALARAALALVEPDSFVFLDNGSTNLLVAEQLSAIGDLTVATSSIEIATALVACPDVQILMIGGAVDRVVGGAIDGLALEAIAQLNIDSCFLGVCALSVDGGVSAFDAADAAFKRVLTSRSRRLLLLAVNEKLGERAPHRIAALDALAHVIVEHDAPEAAVAALRAAGADVVRAQLPARFGG